MITFASAVKVGDFVQIRDHRAQERLCLQWWRVTNLRIGTSDMLELINRHGDTARYSGSRVKVNKWMPGEDNRDRM